MSAEVAPTPAPVVGPVADAAAAPVEQPGHKVFAGNLSYRTTDEEFKAFFAPVANDILSANIIYRGPNSAGYGFVSFKTAEAATSATERFNKQDLGGRPIIVELAKPENEKAEKKPKKTAKKIKDAAAKVVDAIIPGETVEAADGTEKTKKKRNSRKAKGKKADTDAVEATEEEVKAPKEPKEKKVKAVKPKEPREPKRSKDQPPPGEPSKTVVFAANLNFSVDEAALTKFFTDAGFTVTSAHIVRHTWGKPRSRGYGFVDVGSEDAQTKSIAALHDKEIDGRQVALKVAIDPEFSENKEGGGKKRRKASGEAAEVDPTAAPVAGPVTPTPTVI